MTLARIVPGAATGRLSAPPSKSYTHRGLMVGYLTGHRFLVRGPLVAEDTRATLAGLSKLGATVHRRLTTWEIERPRASHLPARPVSINCHSSGTTLRFLTALVAAGSRPVTLLGSRELARRPIQGLLDTLRQAGAVAEGRAGRSVPLRVFGPVRPGLFAVDGTVSSQFVSALLLVLPSLPSASTVRCVGELVSEPYVDATVAILRHHGIRLDQRGSEWSVDAPQSFRGTEFVVPGDASSAAYLWAAGAISGGSVQVDGVGHRFPQPDLAVLDLLRLAGASVRETSDGARVEGPVREGFDVDLTRTPDLYPLAGVLAAVIPRESRLRGAGHVVSKESDRRSETVRLVRALGAEARSRRDSLEIRGHAPARPLRFSRSTDHRIVMSAAVGALAAGPDSSVSDASSVRKSYPQFWRSMRALGVRIRLRP